MKWFKRILIIAVAIVVSLFIAQLAWKVARPAGGHLSQAILKSFDFLANEPRLGNAYPLLVLPDEKGVNRSYQLVSLTQLKFKNNQYDLSIAMDACSLSNIRMLPYELEKSLFHAVQRSLSDSRLESYFPNMDSYMKKAIFDVIKIEPYSLHLQKK